MSSRWFWIALMGGFTLFVSSAEAADVFANAWRESSNCLFHGGCDVITAGNRAIDKGIQSKADALKEDAKQLYEVLMTDFVHNQWPQLLAGVNTLAGNNINLINQKMIELLERVNSMSDDIIVKLEEGANNVVDYAFIKANTLVMQISDEVDQKLRCAVCGAETGVESAVDRWLSYFRLWNTHCESVSGGKAAEREYTKMTLISWCELKSSISPQSNVNDIYRAYTELADRVKCWRCATVDHAKRVLLTSYLLKIEAEMKTWHDAMGV